MKVPELGRVIFWPEGPLSPQPSPYTFVNLTRLGVIVDFFQRGVSTN